MVDPITIGMNASPAYASLAVVSSFGLLAYSMLARHASSWYLSIFSSFLVTASSYPIIAHHVPYALNAWFSLLIVMLLYAFIVKRFEFEKTRIVEVDTI